MTMEPTATRARTQGDKGQPFRPQRNARFERAARMQTPAARGRARACAQIACCTPYHYLYQVGIHAAFYHLEFQCKGHSRGRDGTTIGNHFQCAV